MLDKERDRRRTSENDEGYREKKSLHASRSKRNRAKKENRVLPLHEEDVIVYKDLDVRVFYSSAIKLNGIEDRMHQPASNKRHIKVQLSSMPERIQIGKANETSKSRN
jgi:hypothetical protein